MKLKCPRCPRCKTLAIILTEHNRSCSIEYNVIDLTLDRWNADQTGEPSKVTATCVCSHIWTLRGIKQITDLIK